MGRHIHLEPHLSLDELARRYRGAKDPVERSRWQFLWLLARGLTAKVIAGITGYSTCWIGQIARRYNACGPDGVKDQRHQVRHGRRLLTAAQQDELLEAFAHAVRASPIKQIVLVLDGAGWHDSPKVRVPEHVHLLFLPPHSPELQPAEHLWPLTNSVLVNRHFANTLGLGRCPGGALRRPASPSRSHPPGDAVPLVAEAAHQEATRTEKRVV